MAATIGRASVLATLLVSVLATACTVTSDHPQRSTASSTSTAPPSSPVQTETMADLQEALARWHRVTASVVYRTARQRPGLPSSAHQCLRQFVEDRADLPIGQAKCNPAGVARLLSGSTRPMATRGHGGEPDGERDGSTESARWCAHGPTEETNGAGGGAAIELVRSFPFHELVTGVRSVLDELGIDGLGACRPSRAAVSGPPRPTASHGRRVRSRQNGVSGATERSSRSRCLQKAERRRPSRSGAYRRTSDGYRSTR